MGPVGQRTDALFLGAKPLVYNFSVIAAATNGDNTLLNAVTGSKIRVVGLSLVAGAAGNIYFTGGAGGTVVWGGSTNKINLAANQHYNLPFCPAGWFEATVSTALVMNASSTGPFSGGFVYVLV